MAASGGTLWDGPVVPEQRDLDAAFVVSLRAAGAARGGPVVTGRRRTAGRDGWPPPHAISFLAPEAAATLHLVRENLRLLATLSRCHEVGRLDAPEAPDTPRATPEQWTIRAPADVAAYLGPELADLAQEQLRALLLTAKYTLLGCVLVAQGSVDGAPCRLADAFRAAVRAGAAAVIFAHNHPSGDPAPSPDDVRFTADAARAGALLGIEVLDHVVIGRAARAPVTRCATPACTSWACTVPTAVIPPRPEAPVVGPRRRTPTAGPCSGGGSASGGQRGGQIRPPGLPPGR